MEVKALCASKTNVSLIKKTLKRILEWETFVPFHFVEKSFPSVADCSSMRRVRNMFADSNHRNKRGWWWLSYTREWRWVVELFILHPKRTTCQKGVPYAFWWRALPVQWCVRENEKWPGKTSTSHVKIAKGPYIYIHSPTSLFIFEGWIYMTI